MTPSSRAASRNSSNTALIGHYKVRVVMPGALLHFASTDEPVPTPDGWSADWIDDHRYGDHIGFIDWSKAVAITWRWTE